jgi:hypothetical protein
MMNAVKLNFKKMEGGENSSMKLSWLTLKGPT